MNPHAAATLCLTAIAKASGQNVYCGDLLVSQAMKVLAIEVLGEQEAQRVWDEAVGKTPRQAKREKQGGTKES